MGPPKGTLKREDIDSITNPFDEFALEEALLTKEKYDAEIVAITMGPDKATDVLRNALALGVDQVYHVNDPALAGSDISWPHPTPLPRPLRKSGMWMWFSAASSQLMATRVWLSSEIAARLGLEPA